MKHTKKQHLKQQIFPYGITIQCVFNEFIDKSETRYKVIIAAASKYRQQWRKYK